MSRVADLGRNQREASRIRRAAGRCLRQLGDLARDQRAATAAEFAMVLPLLLLLLLGIIDAGRLLWEFNRAEKATQAGARFAVVTQMVPSGLAAYRFTTGTQVTQVPPGTPVPVTSFNSVTCTSTGCTNSGAGPTPGFDAAAFENIRSRMSAIYAMIAAGNVEITYQNVGLGYAGDPYGPDVAPLVRVRLVGMPDFEPIMFSLWGGTIALPDFSTALTMEDGLGHVSN